MKLKISVTDENNRYLFCRIFLAKNGGSRPYVVYCGGLHEFEVELGSYEIEVTRGKLYQPYKTTLAVNDCCDEAMQGHQGGCGSILELAVTLKALLDVKSLNLYSFDAHSHVSRDEALDTGDLVSASTVMKGEDFNLFFAGSPYDHEVHMQYLNRHFTDTVSYREKYAGIIDQVNDESYLLDIGNEIVKCRYGHVFMMNYTQKPPFSRYYDETWDPWCFQKDGEEPPYRIPCIHEALFNERGENSVAVAAHPTSWWWHSNGEFITNIAATLGFEILAGSIDAMVVMGYERDHAYYQELWFEALRNGYFLTGVSETDASFDVPPQRFLEFKTYAVTQDFSIDAVCTAVKNGRCMVSSGPVVLMKVNGCYPGTVLSYKKEESFLVEIDAYRCFEAPLSRIQIIRNGYLYKEYPVDMDEVKIMDSLMVEEDSFVLVKCYDHAGNVAMTNPVYIRNTPFKNVGYLSNVTIHVKLNGMDADGVYWLDKSKERIPFKRRISLSMKVGSVLKVAVGREVKTVRLFELPELSAIFKNLYFGYFNSHRRYKPGEIPAREFRLDRIREILDRVDITLDFQ